MAAKIEDYVPLEEGLASYLTGLWAKAMKPVSGPLRKAFKDGDDAKVDELLDSIDVQLIAQQAEAAIRENVLASLTFGAMLATSGTKLVYYEEALPAVENRVVDSYRETFEKIIPDMRELIAALRVVKLDNPGPAMTRHNCSDEHSHGHPPPPLWDVLIKSQKQSPAEALNAVVAGHARSAIDVAANLNTSRLVGLGFLDQNQFEGITTYQISAVLDGRACPVCLLMHGKEFKVGPAREHLMNVLLTTDRDMLKSLAPFVSASKDSVRQLRQMSSSDMQARGLHAPPYHPGCRCRQVNTGKVPLSQVRAVSTPEEVLQEVFGVKSLPANPVEVAAGAVPSKLDVSQLVLSPGVKASMEDWSKKGVEKMSADELLAGSKLGTSFKMTGEKALAAETILGKRFGLPAQELAREMLRDTGLDFEDLNVRLNSSEYSTFVSMSMNLTDKAGEYVGKLKRKFVIENGDLSVEHEMFKVSDSFQGTSVGKTVLANMMELYKRAEVKRVIVGANIDVGGYAWAKYGFKLDEVSTLNNLFRFKLVDSLTKALPKIDDPDVRSAVEKLLVDPDAGDFLWNIADLSYVLPGEAVPLGKSMLLNSTWDGVLDLKDPEAMLRFTAYIAKRTK